MAVTVQCFHCQAILELDDGFRGGVCRCGTCGSLLQVPRGEPDPNAPKRISRPAAPPSAGGPPSAAPATDGGASSSGRLDPTGGAQDFGGSSSGMGRIHRTKPVAPHRNDGRTPKIAPSKPQNRTRSVSEGEPQTRSASDAHPDSALPSTSPPKPPAKTPFMIGLLLVLLVAGVIGMIIYFALSQKSP